MNRTTICGLLAVALSAQVATAAINIPSDGSDGALVIATNTVIDLSQAITGNWDANNSANAGKGIYDPAKWAVIYKYSSVTVNSNAMVTFKNHASRAPVVWLVSGDVNINGTVSLDGQQYALAPALSEPGPGGFRGGSGNYALGAEDAAGFGPGGGGRRAYSSWGTGRGGSGSYGSVGSSGNTVYGNPSLIPLIGGSGGGGNSGGNQGGASGGGAILIAVAGILSISGEIHADGGYAPGESGGGGSGGGIRLVAETLAGNGLVRARGGTGSIGGLGRIRLERLIILNSLQLSPDPSVVALSNGATPQIWPPNNGPTVRIVSINGQNSPVDPRAEFGAIGADVTLPQVTTTLVVVETTNVEKASVVTIRVSPRSDGNYTETSATIDQVVTEDPLVIRWTANVPVKNGYAAMQVKVVRP